MSLTLEQAAYLLYGMQKKSDSESGLDKLLSMLEYDCMQIENYTSNKQDGIANIIKHPDVPAYLRSDLSRHLNEGDITTAKHLLGRI